MNRLFSTIRSDARLQLRNGFFYAAAFVLIVFTAGISQLPLGGLNLGWLMPAMVLNNLIITTFYFVSGLVLLEKGEGTLAALATTPLRVWEYLAAKVITLTLLSLVYNILLIGAIGGPRFDVLPLVAGIVLASAIYVLLGFVVVARYSSINEFLLPSALYAGALLAPALANASGLQHWLVYLHPIQAPLLLMQAAFEPIAVWQLAYAVLYGLFWVALAGWLAGLAFQRFVISSVGGR